jgi:hypothetical protein
MEVEALSPIQDIADVQLALAKTDEFNSIEAVAVAVIVPLVAGPTLPDGLERETVIMSPSFNHISPLQVSFAEEDVPDVFPLVPPVTIVHA